MGRIFPAIARWSAWAMGTWQASLLAISIVLAWLLGGIYFGLSDTNYQLIINTLTSVVTFIMVFLIQNSVNRDTAAIHLKLDELIRVTDAARNEIVSVETKTETEIANLRVPVGDGRRT